MDDLRWILLLVGAVVVVAIYFSGRFESEDWKRERKQFSNKKTGRASKKPRKKKSPPGQTKAPSPADINVKKEPSMGVSEASPVSEPPLKSEKKIEPAAMELQAEDTVTDPAPSTIPIIETVETAPEMAVNKKIPADNKNEIAKSGHSDIEDEITEIEIPVELEVVEAEIEVSETELDSEPAPVEKSLNIEPLTLSVTVLANEDEKFDGLEIKEALEAEGLAHGAMQIFHFHDPNSDSENDDAVFSVANMLEPGSFDMGKLEGMQTPGLMLFCQLPGPLAGEAALELMLDKGRGLAVRLHGQMCDDKRNLFTTQAKNHYLDRIATFSRELALARNKMPTN